MATTVGWSARIPSTDTDVARILENDECLTSCGQRRCRRHSAYETINRECHLAFGLRRPEATEARVAERRCREWTQCGVPVREPVGSVDHRLVRRQEFTTRPPSPRYSLLITSLRPA